MNAPDGDGRTPLSGREYYAIREIFGLISAIEKYEGLLEKRAKLRPGTWRDLRMISSKGANVVTALLSTVSLNKLEQVKKELDNTVVEVSVKRCANLPVPGSGATCYTYVPQEALENIMRKVVEWDCLFCQKSKKESKKCQLRKDLEATYPYALPECTNDCCRFCGMSNIEGDD